MGDSPGTVRIPACEGSRRTTSGDRPEGPPTKERPDDNRATVDPRPRAPAQTGGGKASMNDTIDLSREVSAT